MIMKMLASVNCLKQKYNPAEKKTRECKLPENIGTAESQILLNAVIFVKKKTTANLLSNLHKLIIKSVINSKLINKILH